MNRRDVLSALGIGAATVSTDALVVRAAEIDNESLNNIINDKSQPLLSVKGSAKQVAIAEALEALATELRLAADAQRERMAAHLNSRPRPTYMVGELWAMELKVESSLKSDEWLGHKITIDVEIYHSEPTIS